MPHILGFLAFNGSALGRISLFTMVGVILSFNVHCNALCYQILHHYKVQAAGKYVLADALWPCSFAAICLAIESSPAVHS